MRDFSAVTWDAQCVDDCRQIVRLAMREDLGRSYDWTTVALVPAEATADAEIVARSAGVACGLRAIELLVDELAADIQLLSPVDDGALLLPGQALVRLQGSARDLLTTERTILNLLGRLSGIASLTAKYVAAVQNTKARVYDTRKTTPGWRRLEKYAVRCGGGHNHRTGLFDAILIKDNHLAQWQTLHPRAELSDAVKQARSFLQQMSQDDPSMAELPLEVEVDSLDQLRVVLGATPDVVLLDNMTPAVLRDAVAIRNQLAPQVELEASGGVNLTTIAAIAATGVERISAGALTHSASSLDIGLDW